MISDVLKKKFDEVIARYPLKRSAMVPLLLFAQDEIGFVSDEVIDEVARRLEVPRIEVVEVISYYSMLHRQPIGRYNLQVCTNVSCMLRGAERVYEHCSRRLGISHRQTTPDKVFSLEEVECVGACCGAPAMQVNYDFFENMTAEKIDALLDRLRRGGPRQPVEDSPPPGMSEYQNPMKGSPLEVKVISRRFGIPGSASIDAYLKHDGYKALEKALGMKPDDVINEVKNSGLRGRGGAGFNTGMKWSFVPKQSAKPKYVVCNADESEPGTCKDRPLMEYDPHQLLEGIAIAGYAIQAHQGYIYVRGEYRYLLEILDRAITEACGRGFLGKNVLGSGFDFDVSTHTGAGAYECGEETALLNSLEGLRGYPRVKPPFPAVVGLYGGPTVVNNVETLCNVPHIILNGADWYAKLGTPRNGGTRLFCLSGHIARPGVYELPMGFPLRRMIEEVGGGVWQDKKLKCVIPGGSSCPVLTANEIDVPMDFDSLAKIGSMLGSGGVVIIDEETCMVKVALRVMKFYAHESCGWCIPCREGTAWLKALLERFHSGAGLPEDPDTALDVSYNILGKTLCPLGDAAALPTISILKKFRHEFEEHLKLGTCPYERQAVGVS